ncbi:MAG TPA: MBL fold metallo-hydrolase [Nocardioidaceae bacterium]|nr:MBL fold metallo-hydrolase [Nocardioidaceae bacterium]
MTPYDGRVSVGGAAQTRELARLTVTKVAVGPMDNNAYLLRCRASGATLLVDAAADAPRLLQLTGPHLDQVVTTHRHRDHWQALGEVVSATGARTSAGRDDVDGIPVPTDRPLADGDVVKIGETELTVLTLLGHTPGSVALLYDDPDGHPHVFTGDSLFPGGVGKTGSPESFASLLGDVERKIFDVLPDSTWIYPGHGHDTTVGTERAHLPEWRARGW